MNLDPAVVWPAFATLFGLAIGSFLNVVIWRLPRDESLVRPPSRCPHCERPIRPWENIPVLSWVLLRGRCAGCGTAISARYPAVELLTGAMFLALALLVRDPVQWTAWAVFSAMLIALAGIDYDHYILPDVLTLPLIPLGIVFQGLWMGRPWTSLLIDVTCGPIFLLALREGYRRARGVEGLGLGDVKLMAGIGAFLGWRGVLGTVFTGSLVGAVLGIALAARRGAGMQLKLPFGPFLVGGALLWLLLELAGLSGWLVPRPEDFRP